ncbi:hypothetical protein CLV98_101705 [Dyadobacter jejuensis]|uniref:Uncharacterized protein n=1 Tax=Dyadobacter jejuensis TaxID=1082580 RepID=A0A316AUZ3_9BACT|nr:hypothetical protein [Dyadobacter jejuensis]PWJ60520.1 hypothetical protein CLV98_101705 [Dyadobacter jejuensis]
MPPSPASILRNSLYLSPQVIVGALSIYILLGALPTGAVQAHWDTPVLLGISVLAFQILYAYWRPGPCSKAKQTFLKHHKVSLVRLASLCMVGSLILAFFAPRPLLILPVFALASAYLWAVPRYFKASAYSLHRRLALIGLLMAGIWMAFLQYWSYGPESLGVAAIWLGLLLQNALIPRPDRQPLSPAPTSSPTIRLLMKVGLLLIVLIDLWMIYYSPHRFTHRVLVLLLLIAVVQATIFFSRFKIIPPLMVRGILDWLPALPLLLL